MDVKTRVFIDFWNFQINWNRRAGLRRVDWRALPGALTSAAQRVVAEAGAGDRLEPTEIRVYASVNPASEADRRLRGWLDGFLDRQPGVRVFIRERRSKLRAIRCKVCNHEVSVCPSCGAEYRGSAEKGVDAAIVTDLLSLAWERALGAAILLSSDADFVPAVERLQEKDVRIINATWRGDGHQLAKICWGSFFVDDLVSTVARGE